MNSGRSSRGIRGRAARVCAGLGLLAGLAACGTTYAIPSASEASTATARSMFAAEQATVTRGAASPADAVARFRRVIDRVKPAAIGFCKAQAVEDPSKICDLPISIDTEASVRNAYVTRNAAGQPYMTFTAPMLMDARSDDEIAFVLSHEYGHHIADHLKKGEQQAVAGALVLGAITAMGQAYATSADPDRDTGNDSARMRRNMGIGAAVGQRAYSQSYELESDVIATHIVKAAGYDPVEGAKFFARPEGARTEAGNLSFWGTHPPDALRLATVIETTKAAEAGEALATRK